MAIWSIIKPLCLNSLPFLLLNHLYPPLEKEDNLQNAKHPEKKKVNPANLGKASAHRQELVSILH